MRTAITLLFAITLHVSAYAQDALNMTLAGHLTYTSQLNDVRGAFHNGREYALVGKVNGFSIVDVSDPTNPVEVFNEPGPSSTWRDPFYYNGYAYCVNETDLGLLIVNMNPLPAPGPAPTVVSLPVSYYTGSVYPWTTAHNMSIDEQGHAYIYGANYGVGGTIILDISQNSTAPVELGVWDQYYVHDGFVRGDTLWAACINAGLAVVVDISNPANPQVMTTWSTPSNFTHNIWPSDDNNYVFTTDEVISGYVGAYDVSDFSNVVEIDRVNHPLSEGVIPHNVHYHNGYLITSHYRDGVTVHDASDPNNIILTGYYDSSPYAGQGYNGSWGTWPYLPSGNILNADIEQGLFILTPNYTRAARLEGTVTNVTTQVPLSGVSVQLVSTSVQESTSIFGDYATGLAQGGTFDVTFIKGGFLPQTVSGVQLVNGETTVLDVQLVPDIPFTLEVTVTEQGAGNGIGNAVITFQNNLFDIAATTDGNGQLSDANFYDGTYDVIIGSWGHVTQCTTVTVNQQNTALSFVLEKQYYDDFVIDLGWQVTGSATAGVWVRDAPIATEFEGILANPGNDSGLGCGDFAFVTGNAGPPANIDDVDDGLTVLTSPVMDLTALANPVIHFHYWFFTGGGSSPSNDDFVVKVTNGIDFQPVTVASLTTTSQAWTTKSISLADYVIITDNMQIEFHVQDAAPGHLVEGGLDQFFVDETNGIGETEADAAILIYPNPSTFDVFQVMVSDAFRKASLRIMDVSGKTVVDEMPIAGNLTSVKSPSASGIYLVELLIDGRRTVKRLAVNR